MIAANRGINVRFPQYDASIVPTDYSLVNVRRIHPVYGNRRHEIRSIYSSPVVTIAVSHLSQLSVSSCAASTLIRTTPDFVASGIL